MNSFQLKCHLRYNARPAHVCLQLQRAATATVVIFTILMPKKQRAKNSTKTVCHQTCHPYRNANAVGDTHIYGFTQERSTKHTRTMNILRRLTLRKRSVRVCLLAHLELINSNEIRLGLRRRRRVNVPHRSTRVVSNIITHKREWPPPSDDGQRVFQVCRSHVSAYRCRCKRCKLRLAHSLQKSTRDSNRDIQRMRYEIPQLLPPQMPIN